ncbi:reverse ribonuclease integrase [Lasius niger]|uniref:RNA-directed DNA polymerase n=1 Tax=Lasius niger TaxID=67767 RepID=A0A0J7NK57_LASNI|nr:reverse ribonuclease integrase [Lasius niger]
MAYQRRTYPLPNMNGILDKLRSARYISTIDLSQAYFQIPLAKESREITVFSVPGKGLYHFTRMPYELTEAPATFQRLLDKLIGPEMEPHAFAYLDDIVIVMPTFEEHLTWLDRVLSKIFAAGLTINPDKCEFCRSQVRYLGFIVQKEGLTVDPEKARPILEYPAPRNIKQLCRFLVAFASRALSNPEKKYSVTEQECLAVVWAIKKFRPYLEGYKFTVVTDHSSLRWLHNLRNPTGRLARWALELLEYDYEIVHRKGALHHVPDALSRMFESDIEVPQIAAVEAEVIANTTDAWYKKRVADVEGKVRRFTDWRIVDGQLYFCRLKAIVSEIVEDLDRWKLVLPKELRGEALREAHNEPQAGHLGVEKTFQRLAVRYYWPNMFRYTAEYVKRCDTCQRTKVEQAGLAGLMGHRIIEGPWTVITADIMGPFPKSKSGFTYILVVQDLFTKWIECFALRAANGKKIYEALEEVVS